MKVILKSTVDHLGRAGEVKDVAVGYARNFLLPREYATTPTEDRASWPSRPRRRR